MDLALSILVGLGLSAACGFRVFVPLLVVSVASVSGNLNLSPGFAWIGSFPALIAFSLATLLEVAAYYVPWLDNCLDSLATPASVVAGTIITASIVTNTSPFLKWTLALIAGGGIAGLIQTSTVFGRGLSSSSTGGLLNPVLATAELGGALITSLIALIAPILVGVILLGIFAYILIKFSRQRKTEKADAS